VQQCRISKLLECLVAKILARPPDMKKCSFIWFVMAMRITIIIAQADFIRFLHLNEPSSCRPVVQVLTIDYSLDYVSAIWKK